MDARREQLSRAYLRAYRELCDCISDPYHLRQQSDLLTDRVLKAWDSLRTFEDKKELNEQRQEQASDNGTEVSAKPGPQSPA